MPDIPHPHCVDLLEGKTTLPTAFLPQSQHMVYVQLVLWLDSAVVHNYVGLVFYEAKVGLMKEPVHTVND